MTAAPDRGLIRDFWDNYCWLWRTSFTGATQSDRFFARMFIIMFPAMCIAMIVLVALAVKAWFR